MTRLAHTKRNLNQNEMYDHFGEVWVPLDPEPDWKDAVKGIIAGTVVGALTFGITMVILCGIFKIGG